MTHARSRWGGRRVARGLRAAAVATLLIAAISSPAAGADPDHKTYTAAFSLAPDNGTEDTTVDGGTIERFVVAITNTSPDQPLGSVNILPFEAQGNSAQALSAVALTHGTATVNHEANVVEVRNMNLLPNATATIEVEVGVPCGPDEDDDAEWRTAAKQSNGFNGTGNDFILDEENSHLEVHVTGCDGDSLQLRFDAQPTSAVVDEHIHSETGDVAVEIVDDSGDRVNLDGVAIALSITDESGNENGQLMGSTTSHTEDGVATFAEPISIDRSGTDYTLDATSFAVGTSSEPFNVYDASVVCTSAGDSAYTTAGEVTLTAHCPDPQKGVISTATASTATATEGGASSSSLDSSSLTVSVAIVEIAALGDNVEAPPDCGDPGNHSHGLMFVVTTEGADGAPTADGPDVELSFDNAAEAPADICYKHPRDEEVGGDVDALPDELRDNLPPKPFLSDLTNPDGHQDDASETPSEGHLRNCTAEGTPDGVDAPCVEGRGTIDDGAGGEDYIIKMRFPPGDPYCA